MAEVADGEAAEVDAEVSDVAQQQQSAAADVWAPGAAYTYAEDDDFEDDPSELAAALAIASSSLGTAAALATAAARDDAVHITAGAVQQHLASRLQKQQQQLQQPQEEQQHLDSCAGNAFLQQESLQEPVLESAAAGRQAKSSQQDKAQLLTQLYLQALHSGRLSPAAAPAAAAAAPAGQSSAPGSSLQHKAASSSSAGPATVSKPAVGLAAAFASRSCRLPDLMLSRPLSSQLRSWPAAAAAAAAAAGAAKVTQAAAGAVAAAGQSSTWPPAAAASRRPASAEPRSRSRGRLQSPPQAKRYGPGPGQYTPQTSRQGTPLLPGKPGSGSFPAADYYAGSYVQAVDKSMHSPGPIYYPSGPYGGDGGAATPETSGRAATSLAARCSHSAAGTWAKSGAGSRQHMLVHTCCRRSSPQGASRCRSSTPHQRQIAPAGGSAAAGAAACRACATARRLVPGPGSYDVPFGRDGRSVLLAQSCPAFSVPRACRMLAGREAPFISSRHARHENLGESPGPAYKPDLSVVRPATCSPTMQGRGQDHWERLASSSRSTSVCQILGPTHVTRYNKHLLGDGPRAHFGTASLDRCPGASIPGHNAALQSGLCHGAEPHYKPSYSQVDRHIATASFGSGPDDRFDDKWLPGSGRLQ